MEALRYIAERGRERFEIVEGCGEGFYVVRYVGGVSTHDYLQPTALIAKQCAEKLWGVSPSTWREPIAGETATN
jgi:hypothetical protein